MPNDPMLILSRWLAMIRLRLRTLFRRGRVETELDRELRLHLERQTEEYIALGMSPAGARAAALRAFGGIEVVKEDVREARGVTGIEHLARDLRYAMRGLARAPMLVTAAASSIALGVGGNIAVYSLARELLFAAPDARRPEELVRMQVSHGSHASYQRWLDLNAGGAIAAIAGYSFEKRVNWFNGEAAVSITPMLVTANFFDVIGLPFALGRGFPAAEARAELEPRLVVVSHPFWQRELHGDSAILGKTLVLNGAPYLIAGVVAPRVRSVAGFGLAPSVYLPLNRALVPELHAPNAAVVSLIGRLAPRQSLQEARAAVDAVDRRLGRLAGDTVYAGVLEFDPATGPSGKAGRTVRVFLGLLGIVSLLVLLIACANVTGLLIARATTRRQEIAIRLALGGSRPRLVQQLLVEGFWLATLGGLGGVTLGWAFMHVVNGATLPIPLPIELHLRLDAATLGAAGGLVLLSTVLCALLPALTATRVPLTPALNREEPTWGGRRLTMRRVLLAGQVAVSTVLLVTAALFIRNLARSQDTDPGFEVARTLVVEVGLNEAGAPVDQLAMLQRAVERVEALPGVERAAYSRAVPLTPYSGSTNGGSASIDGRPAEHVEYALTQVGPGYFAAMGIRSVQGREFRPTDRVGAPAVGIVNEEFVRRYVAGESPVGRRLRFVGDTRDGDIEIVGVVTNTKHNTIGEAQRAALYRPLGQYANGFGVAFVIARTRIDPAALVAPARQAIGELDRSIAVEVEPMRSALAFALLPSQIGAMILGTLGLMGLVLAMFGLYALVSYAVSRRTGEVAIRTALGATSAQVVLLMIRDALGVIGVGLAIGLGLSALWTRAVAAFLVDGLSPRDPASFAGTALAFVVVSVLATWLPARRAARVSPALAMRLE